MGFYRLQQKSAFAEIIETLKKSDLWFFDVLFLDVYVAALGLVCAIFVGMLVLLSSEWVNEPCCGHLTK